MMDLFLFGSGYSAHYFIQALRNHPASEIRSVTGTYRKPEQAEFLRENNIEPVFFDAEQGLNAELRMALQKATHIVSSIAPQSDKEVCPDPVLRLMEHGLKPYAPELRFIAYLSTIGVYGDHQGAWVDETSELKPVSARSAARVTAEQAWLKQAENCDAACAILRIAGIYGPSFQGQARNALASLKQGRARSIIKKDHVFNRIHVEDIGGILTHLALDNKGGIYNLCDDEPAPAHEVTAYAAELLGIAPPPAVDYETAELSPMARSFYQECKRASNAALKTTGYQLLYPDFRTGLNELRKQGEGL